MPPHDATPATNPGPTGGGRLRRLARRLAARPRGETIALAAAALLAAGLIAIVHGLLPGHIRYLPVAYAYSGLIECLSDAGVLRPPVCDQLGLPVGYVPLTDGPYLVVTAALRSLTGLEPLSAKRLADAAILLLSFGAMFALQRRLGVRRPIAALTAICYLYLPILVGHAGIYAFFVGILLLPAYLLVELLFFRRFATGDQTVGPARLALAAVGYVLVRILGLFQDPYTWVMVLAVSAVLLVLGAVSLLRRRRIAAAATLGAVWLGSVVVALGLYESWVPGGTGFDVMPLDFFRAQGVDLISLFVPSGALWWAELLDVGVRRWSAYAYFGDGANVAHNYLGYTLLLPVVGYAVWRLLRRRGTHSSEAAGAAPKFFGLGLAVAAALCFAVSLGPSIKLNDARDVVRTERFSYQHYLMPREAATLTLPTEALFVTLPGIRYMRAIYRWIVVPKLVLLLGLAWVASRVYERHRILGLLLAMLALAEHLPNLDHVARSAAGRHEQYEEFNRDVVAELQRFLLPGERVFFLSKSNDYLANYLVPRLDVESYNVGGDKNAAISKLRWPINVQNLRDRAGEPGGALRWIDASLGAGDVDAVVIPYFDLRWHAYTWPPDPEEREARRAVGLVGLDPAPSPLQVAESWWFAVVGLDTPRPHTGLAGALFANPNPIVLCDGSRLGETLVSWRVRGPVQVEIRVGAPDGRLFARVGAEGSAPTGRWVRDGTVFFLQDLSRDRPLTAEGTLARLRVRVTDEGCP